VKSAEVSEEDVEIADEDAAEVVAAAAREAVTKTFGCP
jgi:hypothetical protein